MKRITVAVVCCLFFCCGPEPKFVLGRPAPVTPSPYPNTNPDYGITPDESWEEAPPEENDAGAEIADSGTETDAGEADAGTVDPGTDAGTDAGTCKPGFGYGDDNHCHSGT